MANIAQFIGTRSFGGPERMVLDLCAGLSQRGHRPVVLHLDNERLEAACAERGVACERLTRRAWYRSRLTVGLFAAWLALMLRHRGVDLLHSHQCGPIGAGALAAALAGIPHVGSLHDTYRMDERPVRFRLLRFAAVTGTTLVTVGETIRTYYARLGQRMAFARIYNGVDLGAFRPASDTPGPFTLINVGPLTGVKRHDLLIDALARVKAPVRLRIVGEGPLRTDLESRARIVGVADRVEFLGFRTDIPAQLAQAHAFVLSSRSEGLSCSLMEAMAAGLPAVVTNVGGNTELVEHGVTGLLVPPGNADALAAAMDLMAGDRSRSLAMGRAARARAERLFPVAGMVRNYDGLYTSLLPERA